MAPLVIYRKQTAHRPTDISTSSLTLFDLSSVEIIERLLLPTWFTYLTWFLPTFYLPGSSIHIPHSTVKQFQYKLTDKINKTKKIKLERRHRWHSSVFATVDGVNSGINSRTLVHNQYPKNDEVAYRIICLTKNQNQHLNAAWLRARQRPRRRRGLRARGRRWCVGAKTDRRADHKGGHRPRPRRRRR